MGASECTWNCPDQKIGLIASLDSAPETTQIVARYVRDFYRFLLTSRRSEVFGCVSFSIHDYVGATVVLSSNF